MTTTHNNTDYQIRLMAGVDETFDDEDIENLLEELRDKSARRSSEEA